MKQRQSQSKQKEHKLCPTHKKQHLLFPDDGRKQTYLCVHPTCIEKAVRDCVKKRKSLRALWRIVESGGRLRIEEFVSWTHFQLLIDRDKGKTLLSINPQWLWFKLQNFINCELKRGFEPLSTIPAKARKDRVYLYADDHLLDSLQETITCYNGIEETTVEDRMIRDSIFDYITKTYGEHTLLLLTGAITHLDWCKLSKCSIAEGFVEVNKIKEELKDWIGNPEELFTVIRRVGYTAGHNATKKKKGKSVIIRKRYKGEKKYGLDKIIEKKKAK